MHYGDTMKNIRFTLFSVLICLFTGTVLAQSYLPQCPDDRDPGLWALMNRATELAYQADPISVGAILGDESRNDQLADLSAKAINARLEQKQILLDELKAMDRAGFTDADVLDADMLIYQWENDLRLAKFKRWQMPITSISGPQVWLPQMGERVIMQTTKHRKDYLIRLKRIPIMIGDQIDTMRMGIAEGRVPPRVIMESTVEQALAQASRVFRDDPSLSPFYKPFLKMNQDDPIAVEARAVIADRLIPVYQELAIFLQNEYLPACRDSIGAAEGIDGIESYNAQIASHTTLPDLDANEIHAIGLREVERIKAEMHKVIQTTGFGGLAEYINQDAKFAAFVEYLRTDKRFYYTQPQDLLAGYRVMAKMIDGELPKLFRVLPSLPYGVKPLPAFSAESAPTAYYYPGSFETGRAGNFMANLSLLNQRPKYEMMALTLHEAMPGHHLQIALAQEIKNQHPIRKTMGFTGFVEGWGLYSEKLGLEMGEGPNGLYSDPYDNFGRLNFEMWRAMRLVVDTGMHAKGWTRERAVEFMRTNSALSEHNIQAEINRYIGWPGQATGYKIGELKILELRAHAEAVLGDGFDIRAFHEEVLGDGAVPLSVLAQKISRWIENHQLAD